MAFQGSDSDKKIKSVEVASEVKDQCGSNQITPIKTQFGFHFPHKEELKHSKQMSPSAVLQATVHAKLTSGCPSSVQACSLKCVMLMAVITCPFLLESQAQWGKIISL